MINRYQPSVTIGIPTYNRADGLLKMAVESALSQTYGDLDILVSDNSTNDLTQQYISSLKDPRIRYVRHQPGLGGAGNFSYCAMEARGDYFHMLHDDDLIDSDFISSCMEAVNGRTDVGVVRTGIRIIDAEGKILSNIENRVEGLDIADFFIGWFRGKTAHYIPNTVYNAKALKNLGGFHSKSYVFQDAVAMAKISAVLGRVDIMEVKASFRRHEVNMGSNPSLATAWAEDCEYLRDTIVGLVPVSRAGEVRREANVMLGKKAYRHAGIIEGKVARLKAYFRIYRMFDYAVSPPVLRTLTSRFS